MQLIKRPLSPDTSCNKRQRGEKNTTEGSSSSQEHRYFPPEESTTLEEIASRANINAQNKIVRELLRRGAQIIRYGQG